LACCQPQQQVELLVAPDERARLRAQRLEAAQHAAFTDHLPGALRLGEAGERLRPEIRDLKQCADLPPRALGNDHRARCGQRLQPGSEVRRLADHAALLRGARADQIPDHDEPAGDAEPHIHRFGRGEPADCIDHGEPGADRALGIVLMRLGIAEIDQHAVAHVLGDKTGKPGDRVGDAAMVGADNLAQILGIVPRRQRRRADEVAEHDGQLAPLGLAGRGARGIGDGTRPFAAQSGDRGQQPATMSDRGDAEADQIIGRQLGQHLRIDVVGREGRRILPET
jgi:hypothetical protein